MYINIDGRKIIKGIIIVIPILILIILFFTSGIYKNFLRFIYKTEYSQYVEKYSTQYNVDTNLVYAVIKAESNFDADAESGKGAVGLMQLMENTAKDVIKQIDIETGSKTIEEILLDPELNIKIGTKYLSILLNRYNNVELAVTAYNAGIGTVDNWIEKGIIKADGSDVENIPYLETNNYTRKILRDYNIYTNILQ